MFIGLLFFAVILFCAVAFAAVKLGESPDFKTAICETVTDFLRSLEDNSDKQQSAVLYPPPIDVVDWLGYEQMLRPYFANIVFSTFGIDNGVIGAEYVIVPSSNINAQLQKNILEKRLRNYLLMALNLPPQTAIVTYAHLHGYILKVYYALNDIGVNWIASQRINQRSMLTMRKK